MNNLLSANFIRLKKSRIFLMSVVFTILYAGAVCIYAQMQKSLGSEIGFITLFLNGYGLGGFIAIPGIVLAVVCSLFIGADFNEGTIRNKIIVGKTRSQIYFSNFITCACAGVFLNLIYSAIICVVGLLWLGWIDVPLMTFLLLIVNGLLMIIAYTAVFNMIAMLSRDRTAAVVTALVGVMVFMFLSIYLMMRISEPEFLPQVQMTDGQISESIVRNSRYLTGTAKKICQFIIDFFPSGQSIQLSHLTAPNIRIMPVYSLIIIAVSNLFGAFTFKKINLK